MWTRSSLVVVSVAAVFLGASAAPRYAAAQPKEAAAIVTGEETEKRFPPLDLPPGFRATLFACDPLVEYPSVISLGPELGSLFVAHDYTTGLGVEIVRRDEIRLLRDTNGDGYADQSTVYAEGFNSIQGLAYAEGAVFAMHAPLLTVLRDTDGDGQADERRDLISGLGLPPNENNSRLHCANGVTVGHNGWLYLALGDHGCDVQRPEGDRLLFQGGGILRCRTDGTDLHVFSTGMRNIYDVALDAELNVFVRDNENDGGDYMIRVCHSFFGADHGYPYDYYERPQQALPPLLDLGRGSSAGVVCYLEQQFPPQLTSALFCCEWGRAVVSYGIAQQGSGFAAQAETDFALTAESDPYGMKPTDVIVDYDGSLVISDWGDGQRPKRGRGRIYRVQWDQAGAAEAAPSSWIEKLNSASYHERQAGQHDVLGRGDAAELLLQAMEGGKLNALGQMHAVWVLVQSQGAGATEALFELAQSDDARVRRQAVRALADVYDPVIAQHKLRAGRGDAGIAARLAQIGAGAESRLLLEVVVALGRLKWKQSPKWLAEHLRDPDPPLAHAAMQTLRRAENWPAVLRLLDEADEHPLHGVALRAIADQFDEQVADGLIERTRRDRDPRRRGEYAALLARVHSKPGERTYWGYRPAPRPANTEAWERTRKIEEALNDALADDDVSVRSAALTSMQREQVSVRLARLAAWLDVERDADRAELLLKALGDHPAAAVRPFLENVIDDTDHAENNRLAAFRLFAGGLDEASESRLLAIAENLPDDAVLAAALRAIAERPKLHSAALLHARTESRNPSVRAAAIAALGALKIATPPAVLVALLRDERPEVRRHAAVAAGRLDASHAADPLSQLARDEDDTVRAAALDALRLLNDDRAVAAALESLDRPAVSVAALNYLSAYGNAVHLDAVRSVAAASRNADVLTAAVAALAAWESRPALDDATRRELNHALAAIGGESGVVRHWRVSRPLPVDEAKHRLEQFAKDPSGEITALREVELDTRLANNATGVLQIQSEKQQGDAWAVFFVSDIYTDEAFSAQCFASGSGELEVWLNGKRIHQRKNANAFRVDSDQFTAAFAAGANQLVVYGTSKESALRLHTRFRRQIDSAEVERLARAALLRRGNVDRGRELFQNAEKSLCLKCHRLGETGGAIGPDLTGVGARFSRMHLIESVLEPSRTIAPSYHTLLVALADGRIVSGVKVSEDSEIIVLGDTEGKQHRLKRRDIDRHRQLPKSTMPEGFEKRFSEQEFVDLISFLTAQKERRGQ